MLISLKFRHAHDASIRSREAHRRRRRTRAAAAAALILAVGLCVAAAVSPTGAAPRVWLGSATGPAPQLHVSGNRLVDQAGETVILHGVNRSGTEYMCVDGYGIFDGPSDKASIVAMKRWDIDAVRIPLNEACWNGDSYVKPAFAGLNYQHAIESFVRLLNENGIVAILDLHWSDGTYGGPEPNCNSAQAVCQKPMPDQGSVTFWQSVATAFRGNNAVIFDLFNEPFSPTTGTGSSPQDWQCWQLGGSFCHRLGYTAVGMQTLVDTVRGTGATNVLMIGGLAWANDLSQWLTYEPRDPLHNLVASWHSYNFNACNSSACWTSEVAPLMKSVPVVAGETGENDCTDSYINRLMNWMDARQGSYLAFTWDDWHGNCGGWPALITNYSGRPTSYGAAYQAHVQAAFTKSARLDSPGGLPPHALRGQ